MNRSRVSLAALFVLAVGVRLFGPNWDQGHLFHPDERRIAEAVNQLSFHPLQLNPHFFAYGSFPFYVTRLVMAAAGIVKPSLVSYDGAIAVGRVVSALWGALGVLLLVALGRRLFGERVGLRAGFFLAVAVLPVQNAHFATTDIALTALVLLTLLALLSAAEGSGLGRWGAAGLVLGLALATKVSALPLGVAVLVALWITSRRLGSVLRAVGAAGVLLAGLVAGFLAGEPYAVLDSTSFLHDVLEQSRMVRQAGLYPYTTQYVGTLPYLYPVGQILLWGLGPVLGLAALVGTIRLLKDRATWRTPATLLVLGFFLPYFAITGAFGVKFLRYMLPLYPFLLLFAAEGLERIPGALGRWTRLATAAGAVVCLLAFLSIYTRDHTAVTASRWAYEKLPAGSRILIQDWDEGFPFALPGHAPETFRISTFPFYDQDGPDKTQRLATALSASDYVVFQTKRLYGAVTRDPKKYPDTGRFFRLFFAGDLGFSMEKDVASRPGLLGFSAPDELADESFSVYDHPRVFIFRNAARLSAVELALRLREISPSRELSRSDLLLGAPPRFVSGETPDRAIRSTLPALLLMAALLQLLGWCGTAFVRRLVPAAPAPAALGKVVGVLSFAFAAWLLASTGLLPFRRPALLLLLVLFVLAATYLRGGAPEGEDDGGARIANRVFWGAFALFAVCRAFGPEIYWGEKPMDFAFLNVLERSVRMPPPEPWFAGSALHYTYFGHFTVVCLGKTLGIAPGILFNLAIATIAGLLSAALLFAGTVVGGGSAAGLGAVFLGLLAGNLTGPFLVARRALLNFDLFWATSRVVPAAINEYPLWSLLFADLHAHVLAFPWAVAFAGLAAHLTLSRPEGAPTPRLPEVGLAALLFGAVIATNGWSLPTYGTLLAGLLLLHALRAPVAGLRERLRRLGRSVLVLAGVVGGGFLLWYPFWSGFVGPARQWGREVGPFARPHEFLLVFGLPLALLLPALARGDEASPTWARRVRAAGLALLLAAGIVSIPELLHGRIREALSLRVLATGLAAWCLASAFARRWSARRTPFAFAALALAAVAGCEFVFIWDRMNTVFKFYLDATLLLCIAGGALLAALARARGRDRVGARVLAAVALLASLFTSGVALVSSARSHHVEGPRGTLDGTAYLARHAPDDAAAVDWLNRNVRGLPTIIEAWGPSYQEFARISMNTGLPTVLGWDYHVQQRGQKGDAIDRRKSDVAAFYHASTGGEAREIAARYHIAYVVCGPIEERAYGLDLRGRLDQFTGVLRPVFTRPTLTVYQVTAGGGPWAGSGGRVKFPVLTTLPPAEPPPAGVAPGKALREPRGIVRDAEGIVYVADFGNDRIALLDSALQYLESWGHRGAGPGELNNPTSVATGPAGRLYVADTWNGRIQIFDRKGNPAGVLSDDFYGPRGVAVSRAGDVFVSDTGNARVVRFGPDGVKRLAFGKKGGGSGELLDPMGLAVAPDGDVWVCDNGNGRISVFSPEGQPRRTIPVPGWKTAPLSEPQIAFASERLVWITVPLDDEVRELEVKTGRPLRVIHAREFGQQPFEKPIGITVDPRTGLVLVSDAAGRLSWLRPAGVRD